jgi:hypothetical protein
MSNFGEKQVSAAREPLDPKAVATLKAKAALCGVTLYHLDSDDGGALFVASKWAMTKQMGSVGEVEEFLKRIGSSKA